MGIAAAVPVFVAVKEAHHHIRHRKKSELRDVHKKIKDKEMRFEILEQMARIPKYLRQVRDLDKKELEDEEKVLQNKPRQ